MPPSPYHSPLRRKQRVVFLSISGVAVLSILVWTHQVLLPFILAVLVAYVLTPAVAWVEKLRVPRWAAVIAVYAVTIGGMYLSAATAAPRLALELRSLMQELPRLAAGVRDQQMPALRRWAARVTGAPAESTEAPGAAETPDNGDTTALRVVRRADGSFDLDLGAGVEVQDLGEGRWRVGEIAPQQPHPMQVGLVLSQALSRAVAYVQRNTLEALRLGQLIIGTISRAIFLFFMTLMLAAYMMITRERIIGFWRGLVFAQGRWSFDVLLARIDKGLAGVVRGQLLICLVNGVLSAIGFALFGLKYWPILAILAGLMSIVPIFGSILSSLPIVAIALTQSVGTAVEVLLWILGIHQLEANFLNPKIIGDAARIHPVLVVFSLLAGEHLYGIAGALLAVPVLSISQSVFLHFRQVTYAEEAPPDSFLPPADRTASPVDGVSDGLVPSSRPAPSTGSVGPSPVPDVTASEAQAVQPSRAGESATSAASPTVPGDSRGR